MDFGGCKEANYFSLTRVTPTADDAIQWLLGGNRLGTPAICSCKQRQTLGMNGSVLRRKSSMK